MTPDAADLVVTPTGDSRSGRLTVIDRLGRRLSPDFDCALGRGGVRLIKREGDGVTPIGRFDLRRCFYRPDRMDAPDTALPVAAIGETDGWGDDPADPDGYNRLVTLPRPGGHERMWRDDRLYDLVVVPGHNDAPPIPGGGSAIFIHIARPDYAPTEGCVALAPDDLRRVLAFCAPGGALVVKPPG